MTTRTTVPSLTLALALALAGCAGGADGSDVSGTPAPDTTTPAATTAPEPAPTSPSPSDAAQDTDDGAVPATSCSGSGVTMADGQLAEVPEEVAQVATALQQAAEACDSEALITRASHDMTRLTFGNVEPEVLFALPEDPERDPAPYEVIAKLIAGTDGRYQPQADAWFWPAISAMTGDEEADPSAEEQDAMWDQLVSAGLYTEDEVEALRNNELAPGGYIGWRLGVTADGSWSFLVAGD